MVAFTRWMPPLGWMGVIFFSTEGLSTQETSRFLLPLFHWFFPEASGEFLQGLHLVTRKLGHLFAYALLSYLWARTLDHSSSLFPPPSFLAFLLTSAYAMVDEFHQTFVPTRTGNLWDVLLDASGASFLQGFLWVWSRRRRSKEGRRDRAG